MDTKRLCPSCQKPLTPDAPLGLCPECLIKAGFPSGTDPGSEAGAGSRRQFVPPGLEEIGKFFPQLEVLELIGKGGMGAVYRARQKELDRVVALKILPPDVSTDATFAERFTREAKALAKLNHPNIVTLYEFGRADGLFFFLMEFVDGVNLRQLLHPGRISSREALAIVPQLCDALQYAHDRGIVHRDIKPENILLDRRGQVKVADFGLAKLIVAEETLTPALSLPMGQGEAACAAISEAGKVMGTPQYMAPEQVSHPREVDHRADIYALGMVFYQMLTGELPGKPIEPPSKKVLLDVRLDEVVLRALEKLPERRYQKVSELKTQVETIATSAAEGAPAASGTGLERVRQSLRIPAAGMLIAAAIIALEALLSIFQPWQGDDSTGGLASVLARSAAALVIGAGAFHMRRIISYAWALTAALLLLLCALADGLIPLAVGPWSLGALFGAVFALWSLVLLLRKDSRTAFRESQPAGARSSAAWHRWWKPSSAFVAAVVLSLLMRAFVLAPFRVETDAASPEVPRLSHIFVLKLSKSFSPGDLVVYRREGKNRVGRVAVTDPARGMIELERLHEPPHLVPVSEVIGRVVFNTRAATTRPSAPAAEIGPATETNFFVGQAYFPNGDSIEITSVERTKEQLAVKGCYNLISVDTASLALYITSTNVSTVHEDTRQSMRISKGAGSFELVHPHPSSGLPHINMYAGGRPFAELYFGNKEEATEEASLVLGPRRSAKPTGDAVGDNKRTSDATNLLQIVRVTNATTAAVLEKLSKNLPKGVTLAADQRTGQIILEGPADGVAAVIEQIEEVETATQPPNASAIGERRQLNQGPAPDGIAFGRAPNGLAAAVELLPAKSGFALGESIGVRFHIRNVSDTNIILSGASWRQDQADRVTIRDQNGQRLPVRHIWYSGLTPIQRSVLEPGQSVVFRSSSLEFVSEDADEKSVTHPVSNWVKAKPGRYTVSYRLHFPDLVEGNSPMPYDWQGDLETAPLTVVVQTTSSSNASNPNDTPERRFAPVVEVTLPSSELSPRFLNLSARQTYSSATTNFPLVEARRSGSGGLAIAIYNIHAYLVQDRARGMREFETQSAEEFIQSNRMAGMYTLPFERFSLFEIHKTNLPMTVLMPYAGYLQVTEIIDGKDSSIKVRYKLLEQVDREVPSQVGDRSGVDSHEAGLIRASDVVLKFADPVATDNSFHNQPAVSFDLDLHDATGKLQLVVVTTMLIGQSDFVLGLVGSSVGTRVELHDMAEKTLLNEMWDNRSNRFERVIAPPIDYGRKHYSCPVHVEFGRLDSRKLWGSYRFCAYLSGHVRLGGVERYFEVVNRDRRIIFPTEGKEENPRELLGVDLNGDGKIDPDPDGGETFALNETFQIGMNHYRLVQVDPVKLEVAFREVAEPDFVKAREILKRAFGLGGALGETLEKKDDLKLAQNLATQVVEQFQSYNELVRGTPVEWPKTTVDAFMRLVNALQKGDWDGAKNDSDSGDDMTDSTHQLDYLAAIQCARSFGPVIERTLPFGRRKGTPYCLDFESGNLIEPPGRLTVVDSGWSPWCAQSGVDALAEDRKSGPVIWSERCVFEKVSARRWETVKPARVVKELSGQKMNLTGQAELRSRKEIPATFLFKTRGSNAGVLQIIGLTENPAGMNIRYKLVRSESTGAPDPTEPRSASN